MTVEHQAALIIVTGAWIYTAIQILRGLSVIWDVIQEKRQRRARNRLRKAFVAARVAASEECETRMRAEGYWDNYEIQDAMDRAGRKAAPGYRP